jgi:hypothetical protein
VNIALYATIWTAMAFFVAGEVGKARDPRRGADGWGWRIWMAGAVLCAVHMAIAMAVRHGWSHQAAVEATARQTARVYGVDWGGGLHVNYAFLAAWTAEAAWWGISPARYVNRTAFVTWTLRLFFFVVIFNAVVVFARPAGRIAGAILVAALTWTWWLQRRSLSTQPPHP